MKSTELTTFERSAADAFIGNLKGDVRKLATKVFQSLSRLPCSVMLVYLRVGKLVDALLQDRKKYGKKTVEKLAEVLGTSPGKLYECKRVAREWSEKDVGELVKKARQNGVPFSWSHLKETLRVERLADTRDGKHARRTEFANEIIQKGMSSRGAKEHVDCLIAAAKAKKEASTQEQGDSHGETKAPDPFAPVRKVLGEIREHIQSEAKLQESWRSELEAVDDTVLSPDKGVVMQIREVHELGRLLRGETLQLLADLKDRVEASAGRQVESEEESHG